MNQQEFLDEIGDDIHDKMDYATYDDVLPILKKIENYLNGHSMEFINPDDETPVLGEPFSIGIRMQAQRSKDVLCLMDTGIVKVDRRLRNFNGCGYDSESWESGLGEVVGWKHIT
jgi:hypothetical protein